MKYIIIGLSSVLIGVIGTIVLCANTETIRWYMGVPCILGFLIFVTCIILDKDESL